MADDANRAERTHMPDRLQLKGVLVGGLSIAGAIAFALVAAFAVIHLGSNHASYLAAYIGKPPAIEGGVVLQSHPAEDIRDFNAQKRRLLEGYGWADDKHTFARIPIERAMELLAAEPKQ